LVGNARTPLLVFAGAVAFVLLIAYANVASLLLMRVVSREQEMAIRAALGAERKRLIRQLVTESVVLSFIGAATGVVVAFGGVRVLLAIAPTAAIPLRDSIRVDGWMLTMTIFVALVTGIGCGIAPALRATRRSFGTALSQGTHVASGRHIVLRVLAVSEIALALVLLTGASLMVRSFLRLRAVELGFHPEQVVTMSVKLPATKYGHSAPVNEFRERVLAELERVPQVLAVGAVNWLPLTLQGLKESITVEGQAAPQWGTVRNGVSGDYFRSMAIPLVSGRTFDDHDDAGAPRVVVISRSLADSLWPHENPLGKRIADYAGPRDTAQALQRPTDWLTVVGVVGNVVPADLTQGPLPTLYEPMRQFPDSERQAALLAFSSFTVRTTGDLATVERAMRKAVQLADPEQPVESVAPMQGLVDATRQDALFQARLLVVFSAIALVLALVGIYGVMSFKVTERTREIGIRMALGAEMNDVVQVVVGEALALAGGGVLIGLGGAFVATRVLRSLLFGVETWDPATYAAVAGLLVGAAALASWVPARRATRVDPVQALRAD
jgi:putative ABC transport system permease protein